MAELTATAPAVPLDLPVSSRAARAVVLAAVFICAASGLVYELALVALGSFLIGDAVHQAAIVMSTFVFSMGIGSLAAKRLARFPIVSFAVIELALAVIGGLSVMGLYASFAWLDLYQPALVAVAATIGALIGAEIPILMALVQRIRAQDAADAAAELFAADYVGALLGGLAFPFILLPIFGQIQGAMVAGAVNAVAAAVVSLWLFRREVTRARLAALIAAFAAVAALLTLAAVFADPIEISARQALFDDPIVEAVQSPYQEIVLTDAAATPGGRADLRLFLNGDLQFSSADEHRYHETLVHPAMAGTRDRVLILGGGDGLAAREVLRYDDTAHITEVELDPAVISLATTDDRLVALNAGSLSDPRVEVITADAFAWLRSYTGERYDVIIVDMPDPDTPATAKLYSVEFYGLIRQALNEGGRIVVQAGSPYFATDAFWAINATVEAAGFSTQPYHVDVPSFGDWGFVYAHTDDATPTLELDDTVADELEFLDRAVLSASTVFGKDRAAGDVEPSTLIDPTILTYARNGWTEY